MGSAGFEMHRDSARERDSRAAPSRPASRGAAHPLLLLQQQAGNRATAELVQRDPPAGGGTGGAAPPVHRPDPGPPPPPPSTGQTTTIENQPLPPAFRAVLAEHPLLRNAMAAGGGGPGQATSQGGTPPATTGAGAPPTTTGGGTAPASTGGGTATTAGATAGGRTTPDTDTIFQAQGTMQVGAPLYGGNRDFVPFTINASLGFPSHWGIQDWRYHQARRGAVAWWEHLDVLGAPVLGLGIGPSVGNEIHLQPSLTIALLQYHMTQGSGDAQLDNDFVVSTILQGDENLATGAFATGWLTQLAWVRTDASTSLFSLWVQGGVDLGTGAGSISAGVTMGLEHGFGGNAPRGD